MTFQHPKMSDLSFFSSLRFILIKSKQIHLLLNYSIRFQKDKNIK